MGAKDAVRAAKEHIVDLYQDEQITELGLEELECLEERGGVWQVTLGFRRIWNRPEGAAASLLLGSRRSTRTYKTVRIGDDGTVQSLKHRDITAPD